MTDDLRYRDYGADANECPTCIAWKVEAERASFLLASLAEDRFTDQAAFDVWIEAQMRIALREPKP